MDVRFEDSTQWSRAAGLAAIGSGALAAVAPHLALAPAAVVGSAMAVAFAPGVAARRRRLIAAAACALAAGASLIEPLAGWLVPLCGAMLGVLFAMARREETRESGKAGPSGALIALSAALGAGAVMLATVALSPLAAALANALPAWIARCASGAAFGLWAGLAALPLHVSVGGDPVESRIAALRPSLPADVRALADRAVAARRELPQDARGDLRTLIDSLAMAALDVAERVSALSKSASPALEQELQHRCAELLAAAAKAEDDRARQSYTRAADALDGQLDHFRRVRRARERALARLHEDVANLERARFSLTLLPGPARDAELDLLRDRLQQGALVFESLESLEGEVSSRAWTSGTPDNTSASAASAPSRSTISSR